MIKLITIAAILTLTIPAFGRNHCYVSRNGCATPRPVEIKIPPQKITQTVKHNVKVTNNLIMPPPLTPLVIAPIYIIPKPVRRPFSFRDNMPKLVRIEQPPNPYTGPANNKIVSPFIMNNIVTRKTTTKTTVKQGQVVRRTLSSLPPAPPVPDERPIAPPVPDESEEFEESKGRLFVVPSE